MQTGRIQGLADGIFAIALTLLVLVLPVPTGSRHLAHDLLRQWPFFAAYVVSFVTLGIVWLNHHTLMSSVAEADRTLLELNLLLMLFVAVVPWTTHLLAAYLREGVPSTAAAMAYGIVMLAMESSFAAIWLRLNRADHLAQPHVRSRLQSATRRSLAGPLFYVVGTAVALLSATVAFAIYAAAALFFALSWRNERRTGLTETPAHLDDVS